MRFCIFGILLMLGLTGFVAWHVYKLMPDANIDSLHISAIAPLMAAIFTWMAHRKILKDELLVKSMDRLR
jgi:hypothetical protein